MIKSTAFEKAIQLLNQDPLPADAEQQLLQLETQIQPSERAIFGETVWEAFEVLAGPA